VNPFWALAPSTEPAPAPSRSERLHLLAKRIALLADEIGALDTGDLPRLRELAEQRAALETEIRGADAQGDSLPHALYAELVEEAVRDLQEREEQARQAREELIQLRDGSLTLARSLATPPTGGRYPELKGTGGQLNVCL
jgi:hypothetical protein